MRLLVIAARADYRLLVRKHVEIEWPDASLVEHRLGEDNPLEAQFAAVGFDAVIIAGAPPTDAAEALAAGLLAKPEFAPIVLILLEDAPNPEPAAVPRLHRLYGRKIDRDGLIRAITAASREHQQALSMLRAQPDFEQRYRFGTVMIRAHRCIRQVGSGGMCTIYLAESERAGTVVVLKVFNQVPDVSERFVSFDRFLQEYEIVAGLKHQNIVRIYDLGVADDHAYIALEHFPSSDLRQRARGHSFGGSAAPGSETGQRDAARRRLAVLDRFRFGQGQRDGGLVDRFAGDLRHTVLYEPGTGARRGDRRAQRFVQLGRHVLRNADRPQTLHRRHRHGSDLQAQAGGAAGDRAAVRRVSGHTPALAGQVAGRPLSVGGRAARGDLGPQDSGVSRAEGFAHPLLRVPTPAGWVAAAKASPDVLLIDHANCEKKAASTALALMFAYAEDLELTGKMSRLAREELRHYEQVAKLIRSLGVTPQ